MNEFTFYVKPDDSIPASLTEGTLYKIESDEIEKLARLATKLEPLDEVTEALGHAAALGEFMHSNHDNGQFDAYKELSSGSEGRMILCSTIDLILLEKIIRINGITEENVNAYNSKQQQYSRILKFNSINYADGLAKNKSK